MSLSQFVMEEGGYAFAVVSQSLVVLKVGEGPPSERFWQKYTDTIAFMAKDQVLRIFADGTQGEGRPLPTQRRQLSEAAPHTQVRASLITDNPIVRGVVTVFRWLNYQNEAYSSKEADKALDYLNCDGDERQSILELLPHLR